MADEIKTIDWSEFGSSVEITKAVVITEPFVVVVRGEIATVLKRHVAVGVINPATVTVVLGLAAIAAVGALVAFAIANGYHVEHEGSDQSGKKAMLLFQPKRST